MYILIFYYPIETMNSKYDSDAMQNSEEQPVKKLLERMTKATDPMETKGTCQGPTR
jgi:hypothetical protein